MQWRLLQYIARLIALNFCSVWFQETDSVTDEEEDELMVEVPGSAYSDEKISHAS